jgi:hypothetical protein
MVWNKRIVYGIGEKFSVLFFLIKLNIVNLNLKIEVPVTSRILSK